MVLRSNDWYHSFDCGSDLNLTSISTVSGVEIDEIRVSRYSASRLNLFPPVVQPRLNFTAVTWELQRRLNLFECTNGGCSGRVDGGAYIYLWAAAR